MKKTNVYLRLEKNKNSVLIENNYDSLTINSLIIKWNSIINILTKVINSQSGKIMKLTNDSLKLFMNSQNNTHTNKILQNNFLNCRLFYNKAIEENSPLLINNSIKKNSCKNNTNFKINILSYYSQTIKWPNGNLFGILCILKNNENIYNIDFLELMRLFRIIIEEDLKLLVYQKKLVHSAEFDILTNIINRRKSISILEKEFNRSSRTIVPFSIALFDIDKFKKINDNYGHNIGDEVLKLFAKIIKNNIRSIDSISRWGGDEFLLICPNTNKNGVKTLIKKIKKILPDFLSKDIPFPSFSYGIAQYTSNDISYSSIIGRADKEMYNFKKQKYNKLKKFHP